MRNISIFKWAILSFLLTIASTVHAQEGGGWIRAEIDGGTVEWQLWPRQSEWFGAPEDIQGSISFYTYASTDGVLPSVFRLTANRTEQNWYFTKVTLNLLDGQGYYSTGNVGDARMSVSEMLMDGDLMILKGTISAGMFYKATMSSEPDMARSLLMRDATFEVRLPPRS